MSTFDIFDIRNEIVEDLRNANILSTSIRGVTTATQNFTATASQTVFTLTNSGVKNIRSITDNGGTSLKFIADYTYVGSTGVVTLKVGIAVGHTVAINYDYSSSGDKIYPDRPRNVITLTSYPRIWVEEISSTTEPLGLGGDNHISDILISIGVRVPANKDSSVSGGKGGTEDLNDLITAIRTRIRAQAKNFATFRYIYPTGVSPILPSVSDKIIQQSTDFIIKYVVE